MKRTFRQETINGMNFQFLTLPNTDIFKFEIVNTMGAHIEKSFSELTWVNGHGISHLVEHLSFRCCRDYTSEELLTKLKTEGSYNASTDHNRINYYFTTTSDRASLAINLVCNYAFNDLSTLTEEEFQPEVKTVCNEINRYQDDKQTMFYMAVEPTICGYRDDDNILGTAEGVANLTLEDVRLVKQAFLHNFDDNHVYNVIYDPNQINKDDLVRMIEEEVAGFKSTNKLPPFTSPKQADLIKALSDQYHSKINIPAFNKTLYEVKSDTDQEMTSLVFRDSNSMAGVVGRQYLSSLSATSLSDIIREKHGLTYGVSLYGDRIGGEQYTVFACDVSEGTRDFMLELFRQSVHDSINNFTKETYESVMSVIKLQRTMKYVDQMKYSSLFWTGLFNPEHIVSEFYNDVDLGLIRAYETFADYENVCEFLEELMNDINHNNFLTVINK